MLDNTKENAKENAMEITMGVTMLGKSELEDAVLDAIAKDQNKLKAQQHFLAEAIGYSSEDYEAEENLAEELEDITKCIDSLKDRRRQLLRDHRHNLDSMGEDYDCDHMCKFTTFRTTESWRDLGAGNGIRTTHSQCFLCGEKRVTKEVI